MSTTSELEALRAELAFTSARRGAPPVAVTDWASLSRTMQWQFANDGDSDLIVNGEHVPTRLARAAPPRKSAKASVSQVGGGQPIWEHLRFDGPAPVWSRELFDRMHRLRENGGSLSPPGYPHSAEDIYRACRYLTPTSAHRSRAEGRRARDKTAVRVGVFSSITPWAELTMGACLGQSPITTIDYNAPVLADGGAAQAHVANLRVLHQARLAHECSRAGRAGAFDVAVAFSGIEHDGLGRYGDPTNPYGDLHALHEIHHCLPERGGHLLLAVPTCHRDTLIFPAHRVYGPGRLRRLLANWTLLARVWANRTVEGGLERADEAPSLWIEDCNAWQHQQVLVLEKRL